MSTFRHWRNESVIDGIVCIADPCIVIPDRSIVTCLDPCAAEIIDQPFVSFIAIWIVIVSDQYPDHDIGFIYFCPMTHAAYLTMTIPEPPAPPNPANGDPPPPPPPVLAVPAVPFIGFGD